MLILRKTLMNRFLHFWLFLLLSLLLSCQKPWYGQVRCRQILGYKSSSSRFWPYESWAFLSGRKDNFMIWWIMLAVISTILVEESTALQVEALYIPSLNSTHTFIFLMYSIFSGYFFLCKNCTFSPKVFRLPFSRCPRRKSRSSWILIDQEHPRKLEIISPY